MKRCSKCGVLKPVTEFHKNRARWDGLANECRECSLVRHQKRYASNRELYNTKAQAYYSKNAERIRRSIRSRSIRTKYGITVEEYQRLYDLQEGRCAVCGQSETAIDPQRGTVKKLAVDHDHITGRVRGLLCGACNRALGLLKEDLDLVARLINYVTNQEVTLKNPG